MTAGMVLFLVVLAATALERLAELVLSARHARWSFARGGIESGRGHFLFMVVLHAGLLLACVVEVWAADRPFLPVLAWCALAVTVASQGLRWWCIASLGRRWNTRIIVVPGLPLVARGPYRWLPHPNYLSVVAEGLALQLIHTAWLTAACFTASNAVLPLAVRIPAENRTLTRAAPPGRPRASRR